MRLVATEYLTVDGVFDEPGHWSFPYFNDEAAQYKWRELQASDALLLGRITYEGFAAAWPTMEGTGEFGEKMNAMPKYVVSSTLERAEWTGSVLIRGDVVEEVRRLKEHDGGDLLLSGSGRLFRSLATAGEIDLYRFLLHPIVLGAGKKLFDEGIDRRGLELTLCERFATGVLALEYVPAG